MPPRPVIAILLTVLVAVPAGLLVGNMYLLGNSQQQEGIADIAKGPSIVEPEKPQENIAPEFKTPQQEVVMRPEPPVAPKEAPPENVVQPPQEGAKQRGAVVNIAASQNVTLSGASLSVRRASRGEGQENIHRELTATMLSSNPKFREAIEKYEAVFEEWDRLCNVNPTYRVMCDNGDIPRPGSVLLQITLEEFNALNALLNPGPPLESVGVRQGEVRRLYTSWVVYNGIRYVIGLHTVWKLA